MSTSHDHLCLGLCLAALVTGCHSRPTHGTLVVSQVPPQPPQASVTRDLLDSRYPPGSRIVAVPPGRGPDRARVVSQALVAAGDPRLSPDGTQILFCGKSQADATWQIYRADLDQPAPQRLTDLADGAMDPAWLPDGRFVYVSPIPKLPRAEPRRTTAPALYAQSLQGGPPERLTSSADGVSQPTVLRDGRILFVGEIASPNGTRDGLFTINSDGTEVTAFAAVHDEPSHIRRPRELADGRVVFLAKQLHPAEAPERLEQVELRRPFSSRQPVAWLSSTRVLSAEPGIDTPVLAACPPGSFSQLQPTTAAIVAHDPSNAAPRMVFDDPGWNDVEAVQCADRVRPMGRLSTIDRELDYGRILCLDANLTHEPAATPVQERPRATRIRLLTLTPGGEERNLGETKIYPDGSFLVEVPADQPLGLETLDADGQLIRRLHPAFWVRPGENRACVGCHEPHNQSPNNFRPLAVKQPAIRIGLDSPPSALARHP